MDIAACLPGELHKELSLPSVIKTLFQPFLY